MSSLFVLEQGSQIGISENRMEVRNKAEILSSTPIEIIEDVHIFGRSGMTDACTGISICRKTRMPTDQ